MNAQSFKDSRMERITKKKSMKNAPPARDPRRDGFKQSATPGEQRTQLEARTTSQGATKGPRPGAYKQANSPGLLNR